MEKQFVNLLQAIRTKSGGLNDTFKKAIAEAVRKAYRARELEYANALLEATPFKLRPMVASAMRKLGLEVNKDGHVYTTVAVRDPSKQAAIFEKLANGEIADIVDQTEPAPRERKEKVLEGTPAQRAGQHVANTIKRLKQSDPDAAAALNAIWCARAPSEPGACVRDEQGNSVVAGLTERELADVVAFITMQRMERAMPEVKAVQAA